MQETNNTIPTKKIQIHEGPGIIYGIDYGKMFMALAAAIVLIIQQVQTYHISDLKTQAELAQATFMKRAEVMKEVHKAEKEHRNIATKIMKVEMRLDRIERFLNMDAKDTYYKKEE